MSFLRLPYLPVAIFLGDWWAVVQVGRQTFQSAVGKLKSGSKPLPFYLLVITLNDSARVIDSRFALCQVENTLCLQSE